MYAEGGDPAKIAQERGLLQKNDVGELTGIIKKIIADNPTVAAEYKAGKQAARSSFFVGQG